MDEVNRYKQGLKSFRNGFGIGAFLGVVICIIIGKAIYMLPIVLGLVIGSIAFERKLLKDGK